jgi:hypothetical protein
MRLLGFNFTKISAERLKSTNENLKINSSIEIPSIEKTNSDLLKSKNEDLVSIKFKHTLDYAPETAVIKIEGAILISLDSKQSKDLFKKWEDNKKIPEDIKIVLFNIIIQKSSIKALELEDNLSLPFHIPFPRVKKQEEN